jgi:hypothetical protein
MPCTPAERRGCAKRHAGTRGELAVAEPVHVGQHHRPAPERLDPLETAPQGSGFGQPRDHAFRTFLVAGEAHRLEIGDQVGADLAAQDVEGAVPQHRIEPRLRGAARGVEGPGALPDLHERVVHGLFRELPPAQDAQSDPEHARSLRLVDPAQGGAVAAGAAAQVVVQTEAYRFRSPQRRLRTPIMRSRDDTPRERLWMQGGKEILAALHPFRNTVGNRGAA